MRHLREIAEAATPGEWGHGCLPGIDPRDNRIYAKQVPDGGHPWTTVFDGEAAFDDARYIATFDPPTVLALLDVAKIAERIDEIVTQGGRIHPDGSLHLALGQALDGLREASDG